MAATDIGGQNSGPAIVYCDESGFSGNNLLDREQPFFVYAGVVADPDLCASFVSELIDDFAIQGGELKGSRLLKFNRGRQAVTKILGRYCAFAKISIHEKRFALASKFFEYIFEPVLASQNSIFYHANFHRFIAAVIYAHMGAGERSGERLISEFALMMRQLDGKNFGPLSAKSGVENVGETILEQITAFAAIHKDVIGEELATLNNGDGVPNWVLDLTTTSLFTILSEFAVTFSPLTVYCDASKPLLANRSAFQAMVNRPELLGNKHFFDDLPFGFSLQSEPNLVDSKLYPGVQIADVLAAAAAFCVQQPNHPSSQLWWPLLRQSLSGCHIIPNLEYADPETESGFVGACILGELVRRSVQKENLFGGMPEFIAEVHQYFPDWHRDLPNSFLLGENIVRTER